MSPVASPFLFKKKKKWLNMLVFIRNNNSPIKMSKYTNYLGTQQNF